MRRGRCGILWLVLAMAVAGMFAGQSAVAAVDVVPQCTFMDQSNNLSPYTMKIYPGPDGSWPVWNATVGKWEWRYQLLTSTGKYNYSNVDIMLPVCGSVDFTTAFSDQSNNFYSPYTPAGTGDPSSGFGWWDGTSYTLRITPNTSSSPQLYSLFTTSILPAGNTYMGMKIGNGMYSCKSIGGPACPDCAGLPFQPATITQCMEVEGHNVMMVRNTNRCITDVYDCGPADAPTANSTCSNYVNTCTRLPETTTVTVYAPGKTQTGITVGDILGNQICPEGILFSASSPGCSTIRTYSGWTTICK